jgi:hypothetical protein
MVCAPRRWSVVFFFLQRDPLRLIELHVNMGKLAGDARRATSSLSRRT